MKQKLVTLGFLAGLFWLLFFFLFSPHFIDSSTTLDSWFVSKGLLYYRDFASFHLPLGRLVLLPFEQLTSWNLAFEPVFGLAIGILTLLLLLLFSRKFLSHQATFITLTFFTLFYWFSSTGVSYFFEAFMGLISAAAMIYLYQLLRSKSLSLRSLLLLGLLISLEELTGQLATLTLGMITLILFYIILTKPKLKAQSKFGYAALLVLTQLLPVILVCGYFYLSGAFGIFFYSNFTYYHQYAAEPRDLSSLPYPELIAFYLPCLLSALMCLILKRSSKNLDLYTITLISLSTIPSIALSVFHLHHLGFAIPLLAANAGLAVDYSRKHFTQTRAISLAVLAVFVLITLTHIIPWYTNHLKFPPQMRPVNDTTPGDGMFEAISWIDHNSSPETKILVVGDPLFYLRSDRQPSTRPSLEIPYSWEPFSQVKPEIENSKSQFIVVDDQLTKRLVSDLSKPYMIVYLNNLLKTCYRNPVNYGTWHIWKRSCKDVSSLKKFLSIPNS